MGLLLFLAVVCFDDRCFIKFGGRYQYVDVVVALPFPHGRNGRTVKGRYIMIDRRRRRRDRVTILQ